MKDEGEGPPTLREQLVALIPRLQMHALGLTRSKQTAEDLVQSTHLRALETLHQWTGRGRFDGWVGKVMDSVWSNELRRQRRRPEAELPEPDLIIAGGFENQVQEKLMIVMLHARSTLSDEDFGLLVKVAAVVDQGEDDLASARAQLANTQQQSAAFQTALETLRAQTGWLAQVAGYHVGYAGKPREVEVKAEQQRDSQALTKWLSNELGSNITVPRNLPMRGGLTFVGGRVLYTIDGQPIGQIAYHDSEGRLTAFCIKRNPTGADQDLKQAQFFGRLQMIHWQDATFQYAVVGFEDFETLGPVATWLKGNYGEDT